jgi:hypothetical protein
MASRITNQTVGSVSISSGDGSPDFSIIPSLYSDINDGQVYFRNDSNDYSWETILKLNQADYYLTNNSTTTTTNSGLWVKIFNPVTASNFNSSNFFYSSGSTDVISGTGDGGFENTITTGTQGFADNGWVVVNGAQNNKWYVGTTGASGSGFGAYISGDNGATNIYNDTTGSITYFYRDIVVPAYISTLTLSFACRVGGEGANFDRLRVYNAATTQNFVAGSDLAGQALQVLLVSGYATQSVSLNFTPIPGTQSRRIAFGWRNDTGASTQPGPSIDNITLSYQNPIEITYTGSQSTFSSLMTGSFQSTATIISILSAQIAKNIGTISTISESILSTLTLSNKENFNVQNTFTLSNGDIITPMINNRSNSASVIINDLYLSIWEISN